MRDLTDVGESEVTQVEKIRLGSSELMVTPICFGCWQMGQTFWGKQPKDTLVEAVHKALELGVNFFDTADAYGDGEAERILGEGLKGARRERVVVATKVFHHFYEDGSRHPDLSRDYILWECEQSLKRLNLDYIDLYQCHSFDPYTHPGDVASAMEKLKESGKIKAYGVSNFSIEQFRLARTFGNFTTVQPFYNLIEPKGETDLLPYCLAEDIGVLVYSPLMRGLLTGKFTGEEKFEDLRGNDDRFKGEKFKELAGRVRNLKPIADRLGLTIAQLSLAATLMHPAIHVVIVGTKNAKQIEEAVGAAGKRLNIADYHAVRKALGT
ncbi:MAG TPA: aldo/keto reductase [Candidatus Brocadiia bacterium]|nr:aldo/keto reductase [Candidatus Brocadiia bacterium]